MPQWCRALPRPEYKNLDRASISNSWFEVYRPARGVFAIYEPHQAEETISYLVVGEKRALLFDTGMGISDLKKVIAELSSLPIVVLNSHTHNDHIGDNWGFSTQECSSDSCWSPLTGCWVQNQSSKSVICDAPWGASGTHLGSVWTRFSSGDSLGAQGSLEQN
jgi:hypothetical protein